MPDQTPDVQQEPDTEAPPAFQTRLNFVASYPKSGNTWVRLVLETYAHGEEQMDQWVQYDDASPWHFQVVSPFPLQDIGLPAEVRLRPAALLVLARSIGVDGPSLVKSHHANCKIGGMPFFKPVWTRKVINPVRDPREVCCSAKDHFGFETYMETARFMNNSEASIGGGEKVHHMLGSWSDHAESWLGDTEIDVHTVRYEDMHAHTVESFAEIIEFMGIEPDRERLKEACEACSFEHLQEVEEKAGFPEQSPNHDQFFRSGQTDGWKEELPGEVAQKIVDDHMDTMEEMDYL